MENKTNDLNVEEVVVNESTNPCAPTPTTGHRSGFLGVIDKMADAFYSFTDPIAVRIVIFGVLAAFVLTVPLWANNYILQIAWNAMFYMLLALGCNIIVGFTGLIDLGYAAKFAVGAYTSAILVKNFGWSFWLTLPVVVVTGFIAAVIIGGPTLRLRSDYLAIVTLGFGEIVRIVARNLEFTGSASGISGIPRPYLFGVRLTKIWMWYYLFIVLVVIFVVISNRIKDSRFGRALAYVREDQDAAEAMGVNVVNYKLWAFIVGTILGALAGAFYAMEMAAISPNSFQFQQSTNILLSVVLGGMGKVPGVMAGAAFFTIFPEIFRDIGEYRMLIFGVALIIAMIFRPQGLWPDKRRRR
ncbi:MAG: branched-chain amino acid ABC transporter permease [Saccharofermentanales bacterium]|jgi:branched-chain amino acid transport system permease protein|nr:branched-chain amino acid ABC transporter permease [Bacillota bacterium]